MKLKKLSLTILGAVVGVTGMIGAFAQEDGQFVPSLVYRTGPYAPNGIPFADGMAEELLNELARLDGLEVASRSESFSHRGPIDDLDALGSKLAVTHIVEGSVRKSADELRVTVQLIEVETGYHLWSENFDRELADIFAIQEDIARSVAGALGVKLGVGGVNGLLDSLLEVYDFVVDEILIDLHFFLKIAHFTLIDEL